MSVKQKAILLILNLGLFLSFINAYPQSFENTIYISIKSEAGRFPDASYRLNQHRITINDNVLVIDGKKVGNVTGKQLIELSTVQESLHLKIDDKRVKLPIL